MDKNNHTYLDSMLSTAIVASIDAGYEILKVYNVDYKGVKIKKDKSYVTNADINANNVIMKALKKTGIEIISEEIKIPKHRKQEYMWIVDPLDGTSEFVAGGDEFTVNIALVRNHEIILGVVYVPVKNELYFAHEDLGSYKFIGDFIKTLTIGDTATNIINHLIEDSVKLPYTETNIYTIIASKRNLDSETSFFIENLSEGKEVKYINHSSSLKMCVVAEGNADIYPRFSCIWEWDTAAAHAIVKFAGKNIYNMSGEELQYNKINLLNP